MHLVRVAEASGSTLVLGGSRQRRELVHERAGARHPDGNDSRRRGNRRLPTGPGRRGLLRPRRIRRIGQRRLDHHHRANYSGVAVREHIDGVAIEVQTISASGLHFIYGGPAGDGPGSSAPAPPPHTSQAPPGTFPHHVYHTCANGACGLRIHSSPSLSAPVIGIKNDGEEVFIVCQTMGDRVYGSDGSSSEVWDKISEGGYASDFYRHAGHERRVQPADPPLRTSVAAAHFGTAVHGS